MAEINFNPEQHLTKLPIRRRDSETGRWHNESADYMEVKWRMVWFRNENTQNTHTVIKDKIIDIERRFAYFEVEVTDSKGNVEIGVGSETGDDFEDYIEKAYTKAYGRALAALGYGTQFAPEISDDNAVVDAPVSRPAAEATSVNANVRHADDNITDPQRRAIYAIYTAIGLTEEQMRDIIHRRYNKDDSKKLTKQEASDLIDYLNDIRVTRETT
ncbi:hypothetical protein [Mahella sp.]|uniref:hypothetical protein n=1 Tax=Mahella sp. TaxID=2798721 RepID=UPI0025B7DCE3|nr:hypothetical protein [Mahella sp.]MBZ4664755.1 hypothetical protein [Mahella sp.]